jgi:hypothetical protein
MADYQKEETPRPRPRDSDSVRPSISMHNAASIEKGKAFKEQDGQAAGNADAPFSIFSLAQKRLIVFIVALTTLLPPLTASIFYPVIPLLAREFHVSITDINLTITIYLVRTYLS